MLGAVLGEQWFGEDEVNTRTEIAQLFGGIGVGAGSSR